MIIIAKFTLLVNFLQRLDKKNKSPVKISFEDLFHYTSAWICYSSRQVIFPFLKIKLFQDETTSGVSLYLITMAPIQIDNKGRSAKTNPTASVTKNYISLM